MSSGNAPSLTYGRDLAHNKPMLLAVAPSKPPRPTPPASGQRRPDLVAPEQPLPGSKSAEPLCGQMSRGIET
jgi:hypothetical protein